MFFESVNSPFSIIAYVIVCWYKLILYIICGEKTLQCLGGLIVQGTKFGFETFGCEFLVNVFVFFNPFRGGT
jgi:hypothetical protein